MDWLASRRHHSSLLLAVATLASTGAAFAQLPIAVPEPASTPEAPVGAASPEDAALPEPPPAPPGAEAASTAEPPSTASEPPSTAEPPSEEARGRSPQKSELREPRAPGVVDDSEGDDVAPKPRRRWYGWQTLTSDGASLALILAAAGLESSGADDGGALATAGLLGYEFGSGIIHFVHKNPGRAFGSMGIRLGMPLAGAFLGASVVSGCDDYFCEAGGAAFGLVLGMAGAMAIDAAVLAYDEPEPSDAVRPKLVPLVAFTRGGAVVGLGGAL